MPQKAAPLLQGTLDLIWDRFSGALAAILRFT
jgi:hypothetical protein